MLCCHHYRSRYRSSCDGSCEGGLPGDGCTSTNILPVQAYAIIAMMTRRVEIETVNIVLPSEQRPTRRPGMTRNGGKTTRHEQIRGTLVLYLIVFDT